MSPTDVATKIDIWRNASSYMNDFARALNLGYALLDKASNMVVPNKEVLAPDIEKIKK